MKIFQFYYIPKASRTGKHSTASSRLQDTDGGVGDKPGSHARTAQAAGTPFSLSLPIHGLIYINGGFLAVSQRFYTEDCLFRVALAAGIYREAIVGLPLYI